MIRKLTKIAILGLAFTLITFNAESKTPHRLTVSHQGALHEKTDLIHSLTGNFKTHPNKISPITTTHFTPLTATMKDADGEFGFSFFTQEDVVVSAGVGLKIGF